MPTREKPNDVLAEVRFRVVLDTTTICNLRCRQCFHSLFHVKGLPYRQHEMPPELFEKILVELHDYLGSLMLSCSAEPFTNSDFHRYLAIVRRRAPNAAKMIATNGLLLDEPLARDLIETGLDRMVVSIDGARRETYDAIRRGASFDRLMDRLDMLNRLKREMGSERPALIFNVTLSRQNLDDLPLFPDLARDKQVAEITFQHLVPFRGLNMKRETLFYENRRRVRDAFTRTKARARELGIPLTDLREIPSALQCFGDLVADLTRRLLKPSPKAFCLQPWLTVIFNSRGDLFPCFCWLAERPMGNLQKQSFLDIWKSDNYQRLLAELGGRAPLRPCCRECFHIGRRVLTKKTFEEQEYSPQLASPIPGPGENT